LGNQDWFSPRNNVNEVRLFWVEHFLPVSEIRLIVLGLNFGHDASASVVRDGEVLSVVLRERITRIKKARGLDRRTIDTALILAGVDMASVDYVALSTSQRAPFIAIDCEFSVSIAKTDAHPAPGQMFQAAQRRGTTGLPSLQGDPADYIDGAEVNSKIEFFRPVDQFHYAESWRLETDLRGIAARDHAGFFENNYTDHLYCPVVARLLGVEKPGYILHHHLCHAAGAFFTSPFDDAFILTMDGSGSTPYGYYGGMIYHGKDNQIFPITPHHLLTSCLYDRTATWLGFGKLSAPGKLMGLASYGEALFTDDRFVGNWFDVARKLDLNVPQFATHPIALWSGVWQSFVSSTARQLSLDLSAVGDTERVTEHVPASIAKSIQIIFEETVLETVRVIESISDANGYSSQRLVFTGGSALNVVANQRILKDTDVKELFVNPGCDDMGLSSGAALAVTHAILGAPRQHHTANASSYLGRRFTQGQVKQALDAEQRVTYDALPDWHEHAASEISDGAVIGWFEGRSEIGPRALGHRSIVADPTQIESWERVNKAKGRELWRPLAPSVIEEAVPSYFSGVPTHSPYMSMNACVSGSDLPAVTHRDGTSRIQSVSADCGAYHSMIASFGRISGVPVVLNTSFNGPDEPIVDTPEEAVALLLNNRIDVLYIEGFRVARR
jgi:carbamoyltransferase